MRPFRALTLRSTGRAGTCFLSREHRRGAPVTLLVRPKMARQSKRNVGLGRRTDQ
jgi:phosphopantothenoylcysteine synthetase/decarboxylase